MKKGFLILLLVFLAAELFSLIMFCRQSLDSPQDALAVNEAVKSVQSNWNKLESYTNTTSLG